jgi:hypothetical protein
MSLLDDLKAAAGALDIQYQPSSNEVQGVVGSIVHYLEHGDEFLKAAAAGAEDVTKLLSPPPPEPAPAAPAGAAGSQAELEAQIADLQAQLAARQATAGQTTVTHETGAPVDAPPPAG